MPVFTNISAYRFAPLDALKPLRARLLERCNGAGLKGTILLSTEGINLFVAGGRPEVDDLVAELRKIPGLAALEPKFSESAGQPFNRMLVRIKKEIIAFGVDGIDPARHPSPKLAPATLKRWLDEGRPITLLDTRNDYEVKLGTFKGARALGIDHFREFPSAVGQLPETLKDQPVVMFCTGGIRCEKAGPFMEREGFRQIFQLDGGILKYFEECGGAHYDGECFVFDQRVGVDPNLHETESVFCFACLTPLTVADQADPRQNQPHACRYCHQDSAALMAEALAARHAAIRRAADPLPGSQPAESHRPLKIPADCDGATLAEALSRIFKHASFDHWREQCDAGRWLDASGRPATASHVARAGQRYLCRVAAAMEPPVDADIRLLHEDEAIIVLHKPAPLPMHPCGRFQRNTLQAILATAYAPQSPRAAHRLDANTTGLVVLTRTRHFARLLQPQFERGEVEKIYFARVHGQPPETFAGDLPIRAAPGKLGSRAIDESDGLAAKTEFRVIRRLKDGDTLLEARPLTGRTNQIRVHLWDLGFPIVGDPTYLPDHRLGDVQTLPLTAPPLCLHAGKLAFVHPITNVRLEFLAEPPPWASA